MKLSMRILESIESPIKEQQAIDFLINDEKEAIKGYTEKTDAVQNLLSPYDFDEFSKVVGHIITEEEHHIKELEELKSKLGL